MIKHSIPYDPNAEMFIPNGNSAAMSIYRKRHLMLLEVLIAFALVVLCVLPLIYPMVFIFKSEKEFIDTIELDHTVNLLYGNILQKLYLNEIRWGDIEEEKTASISDVMLREIGVDKELPFNGEYQFFIVHRKPSKPDDHLYLVRLIFSFTPKKTRKLQQIDGEPSSQEAKHLTYTYDIFIERKPKESEEEKKQPEKTQES